MTNRQSQKLDPGRASKQEFFSENSLLRRAKLDPQYVPAWNGLGRVELRRKKPKEAAVALQKARALDPKDPNISADYCRAVVDQDPKAPQGAVECRAALALAPNNPTALFMLSRSLVAQGDCAGAKTQLGVFTALPGIKPEAKAGAEKLLATCVAAKK